MGVGIGHLTEQILTDLFEACGVVERQAELLENEPVEEAVDDRECSHREGRRKPGGAEAAEHRVEVAETGRTRAGVPRFQQPDRPGVFEKYATGCDRPLPHLALPFPFRGWGRNLGQDALDDAVENVVLVGDVVVERHAFHAERLADAPHAQRLEPSFIGECESCI